MNFDYINKPDDDNNKYNNNKFKKSLYILAVLFVSFMIMKYRFKMYDDIKYKNNNITLTVLLLIIAIGIYIKKYKNLSTCERVVQLILAITCTHFYITYVSIVYILKNNK